MYRVVETYTDFNGVSRTEEFFFNLTKAEIAKMELMRDGGMIDMLKTIINKKDVKEIVKIFEYIIDASYGRKSENGRNFVKNPEVLEDFKSTEAYSQIFTRFATDDKFAAEFINNIIPADIQAEVSSMSEEDKKKLLDMNNDNKVVSMPGTATTPV